MWIEDLGYAVRSFRMRPGFATIAVLTLAFGIGAASVIFSLVDRVLLRPLPFPESGQLVSFTSFYSHQSMRGAFSPPTFLDYRSGLKSLRSLSATAPWNANLTGNGEPERMEAQQVSSNFFTTLGVSPVLGRSFLPEEEQPGKEKVVILSNRLWQQRFGADPQILNRTLLLNDVPYSVVGVMPSGFHWGMNYGRVADASLWIPFALTAQRIAEDQRGNEFLDLIGRLKENAAREQAEAELLTLNTQLHARHPMYYRLDQGWILKLKPLKDDMVAGIRPFLVVLLSAVGLMLLIACNNIAGLLLLRGAERRREFAIRAALGAERSRLARQILLECVLLSLAGGTLGFILGSWGLRAFVAAHGAVLPRYSEIGLDFRFVAFAVALSFSTGALFGILPAFRLTHGLSYETLKEGGRSATSGPQRHRTVNVLVVSQIAISLILLIASGLLLQSFQNLLAVDPGFRPDSLITMTLPMAPARYPVNRRALFLEDVLRRIRVLPGVRSSAATSNVPMGGEESSSSFLIEGRSTAPGEQMPEGENWVVTPGYFETMGIRMLSGRDFTQHDTDDAPHVVIIDELLAAKYWPGQNVIGKRLDFEGDENQHQWREVIGVVGQVKQRSLDDVARPEFYVPFDQMPVRAVTLVIKTSIDPASIMTSARRAVYSADASQPVYRVTTLRGLISSSLNERRLVAFLMTGFAVFAVFLSGLGLFGVLSSSVADRTHEIGIRMILGATAGDVLAMVLGNTLRLSVAGVALGLAGSVVTSRFVTALLFQVKALDLSTYGAVAAIILFVALAASLAPIRRATSVEPATALRHE